MRADNLSILIKNVSKKLSGRPIVENINLEVRAGEVIGIIGANGSGKTTVLRMMAGLMYPDAGEVLIHGAAVKPGFVGNIPASVGIMIEHPAFLPQYSGVQNLIMLAEIRNEIQKSDCVEVMKKVGLDPDNKKPVKTYSLGMRQRLGIAQAIMEKPQVLLLDEPTNGLDDSGIEQFATLLDEQVQRGAAVVLVSHQKSEIDRFCKKVYTIQSGTLHLAKDQSSQAESTSGGLS